MSTIHWIILGAVILAMAVVVRLIFTQRDLGDILCSSRAFCSQERRKFWLSLQEAVGEGYLVLANVPLATLVTADKEGNSQQEWLCQHWIDFAVLELESMQPKAVVQFERDNASQWSLGRDKSLTKLLEQAGLTLLWLPSDRYQHVELLRHALEQANSGASELNTKGSEASG